MISPGSIILGVLFILFGVFVFWKSPKWVKITMDMWFFWKLSAFDEAMMKIGWKLFGIFLIVFGFLAILGLIK